MKFFSNDAKENESEYDREHSDVVTSDPVAVPQQRAGSPWSDAPGSPASDAAEAGSPDDELAAQEERDGTDETPASPSSDSASSDSDSASVDSDAVSLDGEAAVRDEGTFDSPEAVDPATGEKLDSSHDAPDDSSRDASHDEPVDLSLDEPTDSSHEPVAVAADEDDTAKDRAEADAEAEEAIEEARADETQAQINGAPVAVDPEPVPALATESTDDTTPAASDVEAVTVVAAVPVEAAATPGSVPAPALDRLFADGDSFAERFRDIQLRFVDSPKEATADAAALVGEAVDKVTAALNSQKEALGGDSDDTEQLRVQLRGYRDLLNRLSAL
jgi:hypothetical protein